MSKAEDLLNSLTEEEEGAVDTVLSNEPHIVIGLDRFITVPDQIKKIGVQYDHDIETITFDCPRFWDGNDLSTMKIYINYMREDGHVGMYLCDIVSIDGNIMHFNWTISGEVTQIKGNISFLVCIKRVDSDGNEERHWNSELCQDLYVSEGMECQESILYRYPDIITQLLTRMELVETEQKTWEEDTYHELNERMKEAEGNVSPESILNSINNAFETNETVNQTIKDKTVDYLETEIYPKDIFVELPVENWTKEYDNEYTQTVSVADIDASMNPIVSLLYSGNEATDAELYAYSCLSEVTTLDNAIKFTAVEKPSITFSVIVKVNVGGLLSDNIRLLISEKYDNSKEYSDGDYCILDNSLWRCDCGDMNTIIGEPPSESNAKWTKTNVSKALTNHSHTINTLLYNINRNRIMMSDEYDNTKAYSYGDYCIYNNSLWKCITSNGETISGETPNSSSDNWSITNIASEINKINKLHKMLLSTYDSTKSYSYGEIIYYNDKIYRYEYRGASMNVKGTDPTDTTYWIELSGNAIWKRLSSANNIDSGYTTGSINGGTGGTPLSIKQAIAIILDKINAL